MLKGGVFGFGGVGQMMTRQVNIRKWHGDDVRIVAACDRGEEQRDLAKREFDLVACDNVDDLIAHGIDFMLIASTSCAHHEAAVKCARASIPYLLEKPMALDIDQAKEIVAETEKADVINAVNYSMRYKPICRKMKQMVDAGQIGKVLSVWARSFRGHGFYVAGKRHRAIINPKESGGWIIHHVCHIVDFAIWMAGEVEEVYTITGSTAPAELDSEELVFSTVKFKNGAVGTLSDQVGSLRDYAAGVIGTKGGVSEMNDGVKPLIRLCRETDVEFAPPHVIDPDEGNIRENGLGHFLRCLREGRQSDVPVREALHSLIVCHAMRRSAHEHKAVLVD